MKPRKYNKIICLAMSLCMALSFAGMPVYADNEQPEIVFDSEFYEEPYDGSDDEDTLEYDGPDEPMYEEDKAVAGNFNEDERIVTNPARNLRLKVPQKNKITLGSTFQIQYAFSPLKSDDYVTYKSLNPNIVKVDENGLVTAIGYGTGSVQIKTSGGIKKKVTFTVTSESGNTEMVEGEPEYIELIDQAAMLRVKKTFQIEPIIYPLGIFDVLTYESSDTSVAKVSSDGLVTAVGTGSAMITVTASNGVYAEFYVTVYNTILHGIDVSKWQGTINWKKVSASGIDFVMIRSSFGDEDTDEMLKKNVQGCEKYGIDYGFYHYTYARSVSEAKKEARYFLSRIKNYNPTYPVVLDIEESFYKNMSRKKVTDIIVAFMTELEDAGYYASVYSYATFFKDCTERSRLQRYDIWVASWGDEEKLNDNYDGHFGMWQYSATGSVSGIKGDVDLDYAYKDYADIIREHGLNNLN